MDPGPYLWQMKKYSVFVQLFIADGEKLMFNQVTSAGVK